MYVNPHKIHETLWRCDCGQEFSKSSSLNSHARFCSLYKKVDKTSSYKHGDNYICECGYTTQNYQSFNSHLSHCDYHHKMVGTVRKKRPSELYHTLGWDNKSEDEIQSIRLKSGHTYKQRIENGELSPSFLGRQHTKESKQQIRKSYVKHLSSLIPGFKVNYNKKACEYINKLNEEKHWNLQHAENGGEVECCGYYLDGYDKDLNIVFEYDESSHYKDVNQNILKEKDIERQNNIIAQLKCEFWRYNEKLHLLYKI